MAYCNSQVAVDDLAPEQLFGGLVRGSYRASFDDQRRSSIASRTARERASELGTAPILSRLVLHALGHRAPQPPVTAISADGNDE